MYVHTYPGNCNWSLKLDGATSLPEADLICRSRLVCRSRHSLVDNVQISRRRSQAAPT
jgi:hypothetical protein